MKKFLLHTILFAVIFLITISAIGWKIESGLNLNSIYPKIRWKQYYQQSNDINAVFLGSSHCYRSLVPSVFDSILQVKSFNLGSSNQSVSTSYAILKEALSNSKIDYVFLEIFPGSLQNGDNFWNAALNYTEIKGFDSKMELIKTLNSPLEILEIYLPAYRYSHFKKNLFSGQKNNLIAVKKGVSEEYFDRGYVRSIASDEFKLTSSSQGEDFKRLQFNQRQIKDLEKIIALCSENNIELFVFTQAFNPDYFIKIKNYQLFNSAVDSICKKHNIIYIDSNLDPDFKNSPSFYYDDFHLLHGGSVNFSQYLSRKTKAALN